MPAVLSTRVCTLFAAIACATSAGSAAQPAAGRLGLAPPEVVRVPTFGAVTLYQPTGPPESVALFLSGDGGWNLGVVAMAERLRREGALVVGIDVRPVLRSLDAEPSCGYAAGPLEELSRTVQQRLRLPVYLRPVVVGYSSGATLAFAALASAPAETAVVLTGDGGWAELDKAVARGLADAGIPVVGWSSLTYYWSPRSPEQAAADLARVLEHYSATWQRDRFMILGYSFGADVAPFLVNRLSPEVQARLSLVLLAPSRAATFEFHVADWFGTRASPGRLVLPELRRVTAPVLCIAPLDESDSTCRSVELGHVVTAFIGRGHHFGGAYADIVNRILEFTSPK